MTGSDDEFEDFLKRRKPVFRAPDDMFEPPAELDRVVLRQAREAIESERPLRVFRGPRWATPVALAATLVLAVTVMFQAGMPPKQAPVPEVTVQNVAERVEMSGAAAPMARAPQPPANTARDAVAVDAPLQRVGARPAADATRASATGLVSNAEAERHAAPPPPTAPMVAAGLPSRSRSTAGGRDGPCGEVHRDSDLAARSQDVAGGDREVAQCGRHRARRRGARGIQSPATRLCRGRPTAKGVRLGPEPNRRGLLLEFRPALFSFFGAVRSHDETRSQCRHHRCRRPDRLCPGLPCRLRPDVRRRYAGEPAPARGHARAAAACGRGDGAQRLRVPHAQQDRRHRRCDAWRSRTATPRCWSARGRAVPAWSARTCSWPTRRSSPRRARR